MPLMNSGGKIATWAMSFAYIMLMDADFDA
jgi:hypothetical protein